ASSRKHRRPPKMIEVNFATNRNETGDKKNPFGSDFRNAPDRTLYVTGTIKVYRHSSTLRPKWVPDLDTLVIHPHTTAASSSIPQAVAAAPTASDAMTAFIEGRAAEGKLIFLPGFARSFLSAMSNSAQIASAYGMRQAFCFSWPSQGNFGAREYF